MSPDPNSPLPTNANPFASTPAMPTGLEESEPTSVLRDLMVEKALAKGPDSDPIAFLDEAALLVREAGLEHLVLDVTLAEAEALARAGAKVERMRAAAFVVAFRDPGAALEPIDGGATIRREILDLMSQPLERGEV